MQLDKIILEKIMGPIAEGDKEIKISLFIVSKKDPRLKKLDLNPNLSPEQRAEKLHKWAKDHRFVAVIEMGDQVFAHVHAKYVKQLENREDLSIEGKKIAVKALTDEEASQLSTVGATFEEYLLKKPEEKIEKEKSEEKERDLDPYLYTSRQFLAVTTLISDQMQMSRVIARMQNIPGEVILACLKRFEQARREEEIQKEEDAKHARIIETEIDKAVSRSEIKTNQIENQTQTHLTMVEETERLNQTRHIRS
jgi:hypothetical protein